MIRRWSPGLACPPPHEYRSIPEACGDAHRSDQLCPAPYSGRPDPLPHLLGKLHAPHTTDLPFRHVIDLMLKVKAQAYSVEAADVRHQLDWQLWEDVELPEGKIYIPGVVAHKTTTIEPPELVADRILTYARIMGRENVIAGTDCGYGNRVYPDIGWAKMRSMAEGAALASQQLWPRGN